MRSVTFSDVGLRDRDIIFRDEMDLAFCFLGCGKLYCIHVYYIDMQ